MNAFVISENHDDHCTLVYGGRLWWIVSKSGDFLLVTNEIGKFILDLSAVDWDGYHAEAERLMREAFPHSRQAGTDGALQE